MGRKSHTTTLYCSMNNILVDKLLLTKGQLYFEYDPSWVSRKGSRPLSQSLPMGSNLNSQIVEAYFDNLLPDNIQIRKNIVSRLGAKSTSAFDLLDVIGRDCAGAIALSKNLPKASPLKLSLEPCSTHEIAKLIKSTRTSSILGMDIEDDFRISLAGAQEKTALTCWQGQWHKPKGQTPTTHIFKPPIIHHESMNINLSISVDNEWFCLKFFKKMGLPAAHTEIAQFEDERALIVERFDRRVTNKTIIRLPQEDLCQTLGRFSDNKYEEHGGPGAKEIMDLLALSTNPLADRKMFMTSQVLFWLLAAIDGHAKNYSIFLKENGFHLTPFYDVMSAYPYLGQGNIQPKKIKMAMKVHSKNNHYKWERIQARHWLNHAKHLKFPEVEMKTLLEELYHTVPEALANALASAPPLFNTQIGEEISHNTIKCVEKMKKQLISL